MRKPQNADYEKPSIKADDSGFQGKIQRKSLPILVDGNLDERLYRRYDKIENAEDLPIDAGGKKRAIRAAILIDRLYDVMNDTERQELMRALPAEIQIHEQPQANGQWPKAIKFRLPILDGDTFLIQTHAMATKTSAHG